MWPHGLFVSNMLLVQVANYVSVGNLSMLLLRDSAADKNASSFQGANGGCIDNDDGSSWYNLTDNFFIYGGHKSDFQGHNKRSYGNVNAYPGVYGPRCVGIFGLPVPTANHLWDEAYTGNKCITATENETYIAVRERRASCWSVLRDDCRC